MLPEETQILVGTVLLRTGLLILLCAELLIQIWPSAGARAVVQRAVAGATWLVMLLAVVLAGVGYPRAATAYQASRLAEHSCRETVLFLQEQAGWPQATVLTQQPDIWREFYPWLHQDYDLVIVDGYDTQDRYVETALARLANQVEAAEFWWLERVDLDFPGSSPPQVWDTYLAQADVYLLEEHESGPCILRRVLDVSGRPTAAQASVPHADIHLRAYTWQLDEMGRHLRLVLYWQADGPIEESYTVFVHVVDADGGLVGQQDDLPVEGLAPTTHWQPGHMIRDPYRIALDGERQPAAIRVGLYTANGRVSFERQGGTIRDTIEILLHP
jgi:hypothetical protein